MNTFYFSFCSYWMYFNLCMYFCILAFASLLAIPIEITSSAMGLNIRAVTARIKKYKSIIMKKKKIFNSIDILDSKSLIDLHISTMNLFENMRIWKEIKKLNTSTVIKDFRLFIAKCYVIVWKNSSGLKRKKTGECFHQTVQLVIIKIQGLWKIKKLVDSKPL